MECSSGRNKNAALLTVESATVTINGTTLIDRVSFQASAGEIVSIIGPNGAGKSTLIKAISGDYPLDTGTISACGYQINQWNGKRKAKHIAVLPQTSLLNFPYLVKDVVGLSRIPHNSGRDIDNKIVAEVMILLDISHLSERTYTQLSGGEQQRTQLARVLAQIWRQQDAESRLLILDEPASSLDLGHQQYLMKVIKEFSQQGVAVVMVLHDMNLASQYSDRVIALGGGRLIAQGAPEQVLTEEIVSKLFDAKVHLVKHPETGKIVILS